MDQWTDKLSDYIDGELSPGEQDALEVHLMQCPECGRTLQELRAVVARAGQVIDREPERDLWAGIETRIHAVELPKRRVSFSIPQLAAASVVLMLVSAGTMYMMVSGNDAQQPVVVAPQPVVQPAAASVRAVTRKYDAAVQELESVLERNRAQMDTSTVRILEHNLAIIERAIMDARAALGQEPANPYLSRYLDDAMQKKVQLLRRATSVVRAQT